MLELKLNHFSKRGYWRGGAFHKHNTEYVPHPEKYAIEAK